jgi:hypothetical protein
MHDESDQVLYLPQGKRAADEAQALAAPGAKAPAGYSDSTLQHMQNFFDCVRSRNQPVCPFEMGFRAAITCQMAITSYRQRRTVRWDSKAEDIV